ncbi:MAG TPA: hypothetical protein PLR35_12920, partial [Burkholderiaceae bacterium]|nr:hypothetical protein [Burkholderiaceae bacterium]
MRKLALAGPLALAASACLANAAPAPDSSSVALRCGALIDGTSPVPRPATTVLIEQGRIVAV